MSIAEFIIKRKKVLLITTVSSLIISIVAGICSCDSVLDFVVFSIILFVGLSVNLPIAFYLFKGILVFIVWLTKNMPVFMRNHNKHRREEHLRSIAKEIFNSFGERIYANKEQNVEFDYAKKISINKDNHLLISDKTKKFACLEYSKKESYNIAVIVNALKQQGYTNVSYEAIPSTMIKEIFKACKLGVQLKIYDFKDLLKVEVADKTQVDTERTFIMESNAGKAIAGAFLGEFLMGGVMSAPVGAIAGAAGERKITENVKKTTTVAFDVVLYLNRLDNNVHTIRLNNENQLREVVGALEYILNNKGE